MLRDFKKEKYM